MLVPVDICCVDMLVHLVQVNRRLRVRRSILQFSGVRVPQDEGGGFGQVMLI